jgi:hypothetical protein
VPMLRGGRERASAGRKAARGAVGVRAVVMGGGEVSGGAWTRSPIAVSNGIVSHGEQRAMGREKWLLEMCWIICFREFSMLHDWFVLSSYC